MNHAISGGNGSGDSWTNAISELANALRWAREQWGKDGTCASWDEANPLQIWVAAGIYKPLYHAGDDRYMVDGGRDNAFVLVPHVKLYGGFPADATNDTGMDDRDWEANRTILSGDFNDDDLFDEAVGWMMSGNEENAYHIVVSAGNVGTAGLDGFTVTGGNADGNGIHSLQVNGLDISRMRGGGIVNHYTSPILTNLVINGNSTVGGGGGMDNRCASPVLTNVTISDNLANYGGGMANSFCAAPTLVNMTIKGNAVPNDGGGVYNADRASPVLTGVTITGNLANGNGGGMSNHADASPVLNDVIIRCNVAANGGGLFNAGNVSLTLTNVVIRDNSAGDGGGIYVASHNVSMMLTDVVVGGNSALDGSSDISIIENRKKD
ncbi:hypothetical protein [Parapedobacter koreensis]|uniref:hypothetical protein n=1 Tax=Parapedobacter koreensis TaxID=332977 RepID=UPI00115F9C23|nr:hypothetical protein [Parapedobacter koreensis]